MNSAREVSRRKVEVCRHGRVDWYPADEILVFGFVGGPRIARSAKESVAAPGLRTTPRLHCNPIRVVVLGTYRSKVASRIESAYVTSGGSYAAHARLHSAPGSGSWTYQEERIDIGSSEGQDLKPRT